MVIISRLAFASTVAGLFGSAMALQVTNPSSSSWWVAKSQNVLAWTCSDTSHSTFTVLIANKDTKVLTAPLAFIGIQNNFDCSKAITQDQANQAAGTGYTILLADPLNNTNIFATSEEFEIKALGSAYPTSSVSTSTPTGSAASATSTSRSNTGSSLASSIGFGLTAIGAVLGLVTA